MLIGCQRGICGRAPLDHVPDQPHRRIDREAPLLLGDVLLEDVGLDRPAELLRTDALALGGDDVERQHDRRRRVDRHRHRHLVERDPAEQRLHVAHGVDRHALAPDLAQRARVSRSHGPSARACRTPSTGRSGRARAGSGSARWSPPPCRSRRTGASSTAARGTSTGTRPRVNGYCARQPDRRSIGGQVALGVQRRDLLARQRRERRVALGREPVRRAPLLIADRNALDCRQSDRL